MRLATTVPTAPLRPVHIRSRADKTLRHGHSGSIKREAVQPTVGYLYRLREGMTRVGFLPSDPLFKRVDRAYDALHALFVELDYLACEGGGRRA
jgi:hypothetical protein